MTLDGKLVSQIIEIQKSDKLAFTLTIGNSTFSLNNAVLSKSSTPVNRPTHRGGVYFADTHAYRIKANVSDLSIVPLLSQSILGPNPEFQELEITTNVIIENFLRKVTLFTYLTNSMQNSSHVELNMTIIRIKTE